MLLILASIWKLFRNMAMTRGMIRCLFIVLSGNSIDKCEVVKE